MNGKVDCFTVNITNMNYFLRYLHCQKLLPNLVFKNSIPNLVFQSYFSSVSSLDTKKRLGKLTILRGIYRKLAKTS